MSPTPTRRAARRLMDAVHLPVALFLLYYGCDTLIGGRGPTALERAIPEWLTWAWAGALVVGGLLVVVGVASDRTRAESTGLGFHLFGLGLFTAASLAAVQISTVVSVAVLAAVTILRMRLLRRSRSAQREATRFLRGER